MNSPRRVVTGEVDGTSTLGPGDTVVLNGVRHRWSNPGGEPAVGAWVFVGAQAGPS